MKVIRRGFFITKALNSVLNFEFYLLNFTVMNYNSFFSCRFSIFVIIANLGLFCQCSNELDDCFFLTNEKVKRQYNLDAFDAVKSTLKGNYFFKQGKEHQIEITGHPRYIDSLSKRVYKQQLRLSNQYPFCHEDNNYEITVTLPQLKKLFIDAESRITVEDFKDQSELDIKLSQKSFLDIKHYKGLRSFYAFISQDAEITCTEEYDPLDEVNIVIEGNGSFSGYTMPAKKVQVNILGKGYCEVNAIEKLHVEIKGQASVYAKGMPSLYKRITGQGDVYFTD